MSEVQNSFPDWSKAATRGDVLTAMIWTRALVRRSADLCLAVAGDDPERVAAARSAYNAELEEFQTKIDQIAGRK